MSYSWWSTATIDGHTYEAKCESTICNGVMVAGTYRARLHGNKLEIYGETSNGKVRIIKFKLSDNKEAHGTIKPLEEEK